MREPEGERRWVAAGRPMVPSLAVDGRIVPILHVSQVAEALGLPPPPGGSARDEGEAAALVLAGWIERLCDLEWSALLTPTPARGRSLRNLTVNVFHPFALLPAAWTSGEFPWYPEEDGFREVRLADHGRLVAFAGAAAAGWSDFLAGDLDGDPPVRTPRGSVPFSTLVTFQRWHAAYHYRQLLAVIGRDDDGLLRGLSLPSDVF